MPKLVSNRDFVLASTAGHAIAFKKGVPVEVPKALYAEAMERGCIPPEGEQVPVDESAQSEAPTEQAVRDEAIEAAIRTIVARNNASEFSAGGAPTPEAIKTEVGFDVHPQERSRLWKKLKPELTS